MIGYACTLDTLAKRRCACLCVLTGRHTTRRTCGVRSLVSTRTPVQSIDHSSPQPALKPIGRPEHFERTSNGLFVVTSGSFHTHLLVLFVLHSHWVSSGRLPWQQSSEPSLTTFPPPTPNTPGLAWPPSASAAGGSGAGENSTPTARKASQGARRHVAARRWRRRGDGGGPHRVDAAALLGGRWNTAAV